jgi:DNA-binding protein H-NS
MSTIAELSAQIAALQKQLEEKQAEGKRDAVRKIREIMAEYDLSVDDLEGKRGGFKSVKVKTPSVVKYRKSDTETWVGRGPKPQWVKEVESAGGSIEQYRVTQ